MKKRSFKERRRKRETGREAVRKMLKLDQLSKNSRPHPPSRCSFVTVSHSPKSRVSTFLAKRLRGCLIPNPFSLTIIELNINLKWKLTDHFPSIMWFAFLYKEHKNI